MAAKRSAERGGQGILPAPAWRRAGDYVFISSIYPVDTRANVVRSGSPSPFFGESEMAVQSRRALEALREVLEAAGSSLGRTLRVEVHLADASDFYEFKLVWKEFFADAPPARTTIVVGDEHIVPGSRINLHAVALADDSRYERETIRVEGLPDPMDAEHAPWAIKAGPFVFPSTFPATDFNAGIPVGRTPGLPYYGSDAEMQATYILENLKKVMEAAGTSLEQAVKAQFYETSLLNFHDVDGIWAQYMGVPPTRSSMACRALLVPGALFAPNLIVLAPDDEHRKQETRAGIHWHPVDKRKVNYSPGITASDWLFTAGQIPVPDFGKYEWVRAPNELPYYWSGIEIETEYTMQLLSDQLEGNGFGLDHIVDARVYLIDPRRDYRGFERAWRRIFADVDTLPAMSLIPSAQATGESGIMWPGPRIEIDLISKKA